MQHVIRIDAIQARCATYRTTLQEVCVRAGVTPSTVHRWKNGESTPGLTLFEDTCRKLDAELDKIRDELAAAIGLETALPRVQASQESAA